MQIYLIFASDLVELEVKMKGSQTVFLRVIKLKFGEVSGRSIHLCILFKISKKRMTINFALWILEFIWTTFQNT